MPTEKQMENYIKNFEEPITLYAGGGLRIRLVPGKRGVDSGKRNEQGEIMWDRIVDPKRPCTIDLNFGSAFIRLQPVDFVAMLNKLINEPFYSGIIDHYAGKQTEDARKVLGLEGKYKSPFAKLEAK